MNPNLLNECKKRIKRMPKNKNFTVKDLFGEDWESYFKKGQRNQFGSQFKKEFESGSFPDITCEGINQQNHYEYKRK